MKSDWRVGKPFQGPDAPRWDFYRIMMPIVAAVAFALYRVNAAGFENIPEGPIIVAGNHVSYVDGFLLQLLQLKYRHPTHFLIKKEIYEAIPPLGWLFNTIGSVQVERGTVSRRMIADCERLLKAGDSLGIFPEGRRVRDKAEGELGEALSGIAFLSIRNNVPIVPAGIFGTSGLMKAFPRPPRVFVRFGAPLYPDQFEGGRRERMDAMTSAVMAAIAAQIDEAEIARNGRLSKQHQAGKVVRQKIGALHANADEEDKQ